MGPGLTFLLPPGLSRAAQVLTEQIPSRLLHTTLLVAGAPAVCARGIIICTHNQSHGLRRKQHDHSGFLTDTLPHTRCAIPLNPHRGMAVAGALSGVR